MPKPAINRAAQFAITSKVQDAIANSVFTFHGKLHREFAVVTDAASFEAPQSEQSLVVQPVDTLPKVRSGRINIIDRGSAPGAPWPVEAVA